MLAARLHIVRAAIDVVLRRLERLATSDRTEQLGVWVEECLRETDRWQASLPTPRERDALMKRVLALHVEVTNLEREAAPRAANDVVAAP